MALVPPSRPSAPGRGANKDTLRPVLGSIFGADMPAHLRPKEPEKQKRLSERSAEDLGIEFDEEGNILTVSRTSSKEKLTKQKPAIKKPKPYDHRRSMLRILAAEQKHALASGADSAALELPPEEQRRQTRNLK